MSWDDGYGCTGNAAGAECTEACGWGGGCDDGFGDELGGTCIIKYDVSSPRLCCSGYERPWPAAKPLIALRGP
jgi:hypothetical protein